MQFTREGTSVVVEISMIGLYYTMIGRLRQLSEPKLRQQAGIVYSYLMLVWTIVKTIAPQCCGRPYTLLPEAELFDACLDNSQNCCPSV